MKIYKNGDFQHISSIFGGKKIFSKKRHVLGIPNTHLCAKNQKKLMVKSRENAKKTGFSDIFPVFSAGKNVFRKSGSLTF